MTVILNDMGGEVEVAGDLRADELWLSATEIDRTLGWTLRPEGFCKGDVCVPVSSAKRPEIEDASSVNVSALWKHMSKPALSSQNGDVWLFGEDARTRGERLQSASAPDFELPDFEGKTHHLKDYRGQKVFLVSWASW